jgi:hypothetical protein
MNKKLILLVLLAAACLAQRGNVNWTQIRIQDPIPLPGNNPLVIKLSSGHTANGLCVQSYAGATLFCVDKDGNISTYGTGGGEVTLYGSTSGSVTLKVPAVAGNNTITFAAATGTVTPQWGWNEEVAIDSSLWDADLGGPVP